MARAITVTVNGVEHTREVEDRMLLADFLRDDVRLTGTKVGCAHGVCGSCTVHLDSVAIRSCLKLAVQADGRAVRTVEDLARGNEMHPLQAALWEEHGLQCGFCTPGILMTAVALVESGKPVDEASVREAISGNLCRCTGYHSIVAAVLRVAQELGAGASAAQEAERT